VATFRVRRVVGNNVDSDCAIACYQQSDRTLISQLVKYCRVHGCVCPEHGRYNAGLFTELRSRWRPRHGHKSAKMTRIIIRMVGRNFCRLD